MKNLIKLVIFTPKSHADIIRQAIGNAGAGKIGNYTHCSFSTNGIGRYKPIKGASPHIGEVDKFEKVAEEKIECVCEKNKAKTIIAAIRRVHPYEEVPIDIYQLLDEEIL